MGTDGEKDLMESMLLAHLDDNDVSDRLYKHQPCYSHRM